jgi:hypothetical protein
MALSLQGFHQQPLGPFDRDPLDRSVSTQPIGQVTRARDVVGELALMNHPTCRI